MDANINPIELCGTVAAVIYQNEENGYTVLKLDVDDGRRWSSAAFRMPCRVSP